MGEVIVHTYDEPNLKRLKKDKDADCTICVFAEKVNLVDGGEGYICKARLYDIKTHACFVRKY